MLTLITVSSALGACSIDTCHQNSGRKRVNQLESRDIQRLYAAMQSHKCLSGRVVRHTHAVLRQVLERAVEWKLIVRNPADSLKRKLSKVPEAERRVLDETEAPLFCERVATGHTAWCSSLLCFQECDPKNT